MSPSRRALSAFIVWYLLALVVAAVPRPSAIEAPEPVRHRPYDAVSARLTPWLGSAARFLAKGAGVVSSSLAPIRSVTGDVLTQAGMSQRWDMFANPLQNAQYLRVKWYVSTAGSGTAGRPSWSTTRLILPTSREDRVRGVRSFRHFSFDRPLAGALDRFHPSGNPSDTASLREFEGALRPAIRYLTAEFERSRLETNERVVRIEVWHGEADIDAPNATDDLRQRPARRLESLRNYYDGDIDEPVMNGALPPYYAVQIERDIRWTLEYVESR